ncbi:hypothetical protein [Bradyrhizobium sp. CCBAU 51627]|uniref:hypothetical protein n=1 Tax=Bradyrhizobium sp. CCBAU 51627 TaxID=1325088 RepID=UPI0023062CA6|nr:hypothetical protein [Bradyrhizobium sp. CCBAU 51627]
MKVLERIIGYSLLLLMIVAVVMIVGQPQTTGGNQEAFSGCQRATISLDMAISTFAESRRFTLSHY